MNKIKEICEWHRHLFWLIGWIFWCIIQFDFESALDTYCWLIIHFNCKTECIGRFKASLKQQIINVIVETVGCVLYFTILTIITKCLINLIKLILSL